MLQPADKVEPVGYPTQKPEKLIEMLLVEDVDNKKFLTGLFNAMYDELPAPKIKKKK